MHVYVMWVSGGWDSNKQRSIFDWWDKTYDLVEKENGREVHIADAYYYHQDYTSSYYTTYMNRSIISIYCRTVNLLETHGPWWT